MKTVCYLGDPISHYMRNWLNHFAEHGWKVDIITRNPVDKKLLHLNVTQHELPIHRAKYGFLVNFGFPIHLIKINRIIHKIKPDIVHAHEPAGYGIYAPAIKETPFILNEWGPSHIKNSKGLHRLLEKHAYKKADLVLTEVEDTKYILAKEYNIKKEKIKTLLWGVDLSIFNRNYLDETVELKKRLNIKSGDFVIVYTRAVDPFYGIEQVLNVLKELSNDFSSVKLIFFKYGCSDSYYRKLSELIEQLDLTRNVIVENHVDSKQIPIYYNVADLSINLLEEDNGSPVIAEAMACGCIVLGTNCRGYKNRIIDGKNGFLVEDRNDIKRTVEIIKSCILNPTIKENFYKFNKQYVESNENWNRQMGKMEQMYLKLMECYK